MWAPLPVGITDPVERLRTVSASMEELKRSGPGRRGAGADPALGFRAADDHVPGGPAAARQRLFNLVVTNVPGPQFPLYLLGRELEAIFPMVPLAKNTALGIAIMSYNGQLNFGLVRGLRRAELTSNLLADELRESIEELAAAAGGPRPDKGRRNGRSSPLRAAT